MKRFRLSTESWTIAALGIADLITTIVWVQTHGAKEGNPVFSTYLSHGIAVFSAMKIVLLVAPIFLLEWARQKSPVFTRRASRLGISAYLTMYCLGFVSLNGHLFRPRAAEASDVQIKSTVKHSKSHLVAGIHSANRTDKKPIN